MELFDQKKEILSVVNVTELKLAFMVRIKKN